jgi:hypothetical protein
MAVMVVTRLRLRSPALLDDFFNASVAVLEQAQASPGNLGADAMAEANDVWWTVTGWQGYDAMRAFVDGEPHRSTVGRLDDWCDEATFVDWEQASPNLPDWPSSYSRLVADGKSASLTNASAANQEREFPAPVIPAPPEQ